MLNAGTNPTRVFYCMLSIDHVVKVNRADVRLVCVVFKKCLRPGDASLSHGAVLSLHVVAKNRRKIRRRSTVGLVPLPLNRQSAATDFGGDIYTHPALRVGARGWHPDVGKVWRGYPGVVQENVLIIMHLSRRSTVSPKSSLLFLS